MQSTKLGACEACRVLKVRCEPASNSSSSSNNNNNSYSNNNSVGDILPSNSERPPCRRCRDIGHDCVYPERRRTKRKRTDVRVRELEREVQQLAETLRQQQQQQQQQQQRDDSYGGDGGDGLAGSVHVGRTPRMPSSVLVAAHPAPVALSTLPLPATAAVDSADPVAAGLMPMSLAVRLFRRYVLTMAPQRPIVVFPAVTPANEHTLPTDEAVVAVAEQVRLQTPVLFLSIVTVAVNMGMGMDRDGEDGDDDDDADDDYDDDDGELGGGRGAIASTVRAAGTARIDGIDGDENDALGLTLDALLLRVFAERVVLGGQKSIELVQALLVSSTWNFYSLGGESADVDNSMSSRPQPGNSCGMQSRSSQHIHQAVSMAIDLSMSHHDDQSRSSHSSNSKNGSDQPGGALVFERTLLACHCFSVSLGLHRQAKLSFTPRMAECLATLETSPLAAPTDATLAAWVHLHRILDTAADSMGLRFVERDGAARRTGSSTRGSVNFADPDIQRSLQNATLQLEQWRQRAISTCMNNALLMQYYTVLCLLHEPCFYSEFDPYDFKPPYRVAVPTSSARILGSVEQPRPRPLLSAAHLQSRQVCLASARAMIGVFLASPMKQLRSCPVVSYARISYAIIVLIKLELSTVLPGGAMHGLVVRDVAGGGSGSGGKSSATQIHHYLHNLLWKMEQLRARRCCLARMWMPFVQVLSEWYDRFLLPAAEGRSISSRAITRTSDIGPVLRPLRHCHPLLPQSGNGATPTPTPTPKRPALPASATTPQQLPDFYAMPHDFGAIYEDGQAMQALGQRSGASYGSRDMGSSSLAAATDNDDDEQLTLSMMLMGDADNWMEQLEQISNVQSCLDGMFTDEMFI